MNQNPAVTQRPLRPDLAPTLVAALSDETDADAPTVRIARAMLEDACHVDATDVHIEPHRNGARVRFRIDGSVRDICQLTPDQSRILTNQVKTHSGLNAVVHFTPVETRARFDSKAGAVDLRISVAPALNGDTIAIRLLHANRLGRSISELGMSQANRDLLADWMAEINGMFAAVGPTGSGKTTTLYAILNCLKMTNRRIVSLEDPVEYQMDGISQIQINELHDFQFSDGIKAVLRHDPDYLVVGEIRDPASAQTAVSAAVAGRVLLTTMHSRDCVGAVTALRSWQLGDHEIAESLSIVVAQRLVRRRCIHCGERKPLSKRQAGWFRSLKIEVPPNLWESKGCDQCHGLGFKGRIGLYELWRLDDSDYEMILNHSDERRLRTSLATKDHRFLLHEAVDLLREGTITFDETRRAVAGTISFTASSLQAPPKA